MHAAPPPTENVYRRPFCLPDMLNQGETLFGFIPHLVRRGGGSQIRSLFADWGWVPGRSATGQEPLPEHPLPEASGAPLLGSLKIAQNRTTPPKITHGSELACCAVVCLWFKWIVFVVCICLQSYDPQERMRQKLRRWRLPVLPSDTLWSCTLRSA